MEARRACCSAMHSCRTDRGLVFSWCLVSGFGLYLKINSKEADREWRSMETGHETGRWIETAPLPPTPSYPRDWCPMLHGINFPWYRGHEGVSDSIVRWQARRGLAGGPVEATGVDGGG